MSLLASCRDAARAFGPPGPADQFFFAFAKRFTSVARNSKYETARLKLAHSALVPSRVFDDTSIWTSESGPTHTLTVGGALIHGHYELDARPSVPSPTMVGETRHIVALRRDGAGDYVWDTRVDLGVGMVAAVDFGHAVAGLLAAPEGREEGDLRNDYRTAFPRTTVALGQLFSLDKLRAVRASDGTTSTLVEIGVHSRELERYFPVFGRYLGKYVGPARVHMTMIDRAGAVWIELAGRDGRIVALWRTSHGHLAPLTGPERPLPDTLRLITDYGMKVKLVTMGVRQLVSDFVITAGDHERSWTMISRREPDWQLPFGSQHLIRSSLRRPFDGAGLIFRVEVRDSSGGQTLFTRQTHVAVQESAIVRLLGGLGAHAAQDFDERAEREEDLFLREVFLAVGADFRSLSP